MPEQATIDSFIASSFRSVWALDLLSHLVATPDQFHSPADLVAALRASDAVVSQSVQSLAAAGLAIIDEQGRVAYHRASSERAELVGAAIDYYGRSPDKVRRLIVAQAAPGVTAFADAFKLRKD